MSNQRNPHTYAEAMKELEQIVKELDVGNINIDELTQKIKRATLLIRFCKGKLKNTEKDVKEILEGMDDKQD